LEISYNGKNFCGWQKQPGNLPSIQSTIEAAIVLIVREPVRLTGAGRTDAGVHAIQQFAHWDYEHELPGDFLFRLNAILPPDISITRIYQARAHQLHARFDAISRSYRYHIRRKKAALAAESAWLMTFAIDPAALTQATDLLLKYHDFASFCKSGAANQNTCCQIQAAGWDTESVTDEWIFQITANRFLRGMIRGIVGTLIEVGRGKKTVADFEQIIVAKDRKAAGIQAPAHGLYLSAVRYPMHSLIPLLSV
jgi:tRNA pseudouridine38-40 synthase